MFPDLTFLNYVVSVARQLKWAWEFLLLQSFYQPRPYKFAMAEVPELGVRQFEGGAEESIECAVCLCKIEHGEEVRDLRCEHLFHKVCLDRWLGTGRMTCPLCRNRVKPSQQRHELAELHHEVIVVDVFGGRRRDRCTWWLR